MADTTTKVAGIALALVLLGAVFMAGLGFLGILITLSQTGEDAGDEMSGNEDAFKFVEEPELAQAKSDARSRYEESVKASEAARENAPAERGFTVEGSYSPAPMPELDIGSGSGSSTRGDDLHSTDGYITEKNAPSVPNVDLKTTAGLLGDNSEVLISATKNMDPKTAPEGIGDISYPEQIELPADEEGGSVDADKLDGAEEQVKGVEDSLKEKLGGFAPEMDEAGLDQSALSSLNAHQSVKSMSDSDLDGNYEKVQIVNITYGMRNNTDGTTLEFVAGYEMKMVDADDDGTPDHKEENAVIYAKLTYKNKTVAEGVSYTHVLRNDTDGDYVVDELLAQHLAYGWIADGSGDVLSAARAFEYKAADNDNDGTPDREEATGIVFFRKTSVQTLVPLREAVVIVHVVKDGSELEYGQIAFQRFNDTAGNTLLEEGYVLYYTDDGSVKALIGIAGRNDTENGTVQYALLNATDDGSMKSVSAIAVKNTTFEGRVLTEAVYIQWNDTGSHQEGVIAAASNDTVVEAFALISLKRDLSGGVVTFENATGIVGRVDRTNGKNATFLFAQKVTADTDADGIPESIKEGLGIGASSDADLDGVAEKEGYFLAMRERTDSDSDGNFETDHKVVIMGYKVDPDSDGTIESERGLVINNTYYDNNTNGNVELSKEALIGFEKTYGPDHERYVVAWKEREDLNDDGTQINEQSGLFTVEK